MAKRGQSGVEYMVVLAFALAIFVPLLYLLFSSYSGYSAETAQAQAAQMVREIVATSERVWHHGPPTRLTFEMRVPDRISNVTIRRNNPGSGCTECTELVIFMQDGGSASASTFVDIRGSY